MNIPSAAAFSHRTQVLVVGGGPVGLFAALCAVDRGLNVTVVERGFRGYARGHATVLHPSSVRLLAGFGLSAKLFEQGHAVDYVELYDRKELLSTLELSSPALCVPQSVIEEQLLKALHERDVDVRAPCEVSSLTQDESGVRAHVVRRELATLGSPEREADWRAVEHYPVHASFVLAADGRNSFVRGELGIDSLQVGPKETFAMFDGPYSAPGNAIQLSFSGGLGAAVLPLSNGRRWGFELPAESSLVPDVAHLRSLVCERAAWQEELPEAVTWSTIAHFDRRLARPFGRGRVWLAGDAAHATSPFGGQSVNGGLAEAHELVTHMADCIAGKEALEVLGLVAARREREWKRVLGFAQLDARPKTASWVLEHARRLAPALPASGQDLHSLLDQLGVAIH